MLIIDTHTHLYDCYNFEVFFDSAICNLSKHRQNPEDKLAIILFENLDSYWFDQLRDGHLNKKIGGFVIKTNSSDNDFSIVKGGNELHVLRGVQYNSAERIEVLGVAARKKYANFSLVDLIDAIQSDGGYPILPWGFGKWSGNRGALLTQLISSKKVTYSLGDNRGRLKLLPFPSQFSKAAKKNINIFPGSDPLPVRGQEKKVGLAGITINNINLNKKISPQILTHLNENTIEYDVFSSHNGIVEFVMNQLKMRI